MTLVILKYISLFFVFLASLIPGCWVFANPSASLKKTHLQQALARGIFFGLALLDLIPDALTATTAYPWPMLACALSFMLLLWLEHLGPRKGLALVSALTLALHSLLMGMAMGLSPTLITTLFILLAILVHKGQESYALAQLLRQQTQAMTQKIYFGFFTLMTPLGILCATWLSHHVLVHPILLHTLLGASAGALLYLGTLHGYLPTHNQPPQCCDKKAFLGFVIGLLVISGIGSIS